MLKLTLTIVLGLALGGLAQAQNTGCSNSTATAFLDGANVAYTPLVKSGTACATQGSPPATFKMGYYTDGTTYSNTLSAVSAAHATKLAAVAAAIGPLDATGSSCSAANPVAAGCAVVMVGIGFSNKQYEDCSTTDTVSGSSSAPGYNCASYSFAKVMNAAQLLGSPTVATDVLFIPLAQGAMTIDKWAEATQFNGGVPLSSALNTNAAPWGAVLGAAANAGNPAVASFLTHLGVNPKQVQIAYIKTADVYPWSGGPNPGSTGDNDSANNRGQLSQLGHAFPCLAADVSSLGLAGRTGGSEVCFNLAQLGTVVRNLKTVFPNLTLALVNSRIYGGFNISTINAEPYAYEYAFAVQQLIRAQIVQADNAGATDAVAGDLSYAHAPTLAWGPYLWAGQCTGPTSDIRSDGLCYATSDMAGDLVHPAQGAITKIVSGVASWIGSVGFFQSNAGTQPWFATVNPTATPTATATPNAGGVLFLH